jgi:hypothetical protein
MLTTELDRTQRGTRRKLWTWTLVLTVGTCGQAVGGERGRLDPDRQPFLQRFHPAGGWNPDGGGLLHWWNPHCFPRCGGPDDYCRKPPPNVCWPPYPPYYMWGTPQSAHPGSDDRQSRKKVY